MRFVHVLINFNDYYFLSRPFSIAWDTLSFKYMFFASWEWSIFYPRNKMEEQKKRKKEKIKPISWPLANSKHVTNCSLFNINFKLCAFGPHQFTTIFSSFLISDTIKCILWSERIKLEMMRTYLKNTINAPHSPWSNDEIFSATFHSLPISFSLISFLDFAIYRKLWHNDRNKIIYVQKRMRTSNIEYELVLLGFEMHDNNKWHTYSNPTAKRLKHFPYSIVIFNCSFDSFAHSFVLSFGVNNHFNI